MGEQYFAGAPSVASAPRHVTLTLPDMTVELTTDRGVFSHDRIDAGTKLLLLDAPLPATPVQHALDLGCGYGPIAIAVARRLPDATVWALDVNERAVDLCRANAAEAGCDGVRAGLVSDAEPFGPVPDDVRFDLLLSNPPIRIGKGALHDLLLRWLDRLAPAGQAVLVVQKHLGSDSLQRWLVDQGFPTERLTSRAGYRLLQVRPRAERHA